ncbi:MAG: nucleotidyltransferase family protein [Nocardioidaceae bacterium]
MCREHGVRRLVIFGSALTEHFDPCRSDIDFLVEFADDLTDRFDASFDLLESLALLVGRPVDLATRRALDNPYFAESVRRSSEELYAA